MEQVEFRKNAQDMIYLTYCAVNGKVPEASKIEALNLEALFKVCQKHILTACAAYALEAAGIHDNQFTQAKEKAVRKNILLDMERGKILARLEQEQIWYMPLKGAILKDWYPKLGMRQMSDNDILCDGSCRRRIHDIMLDMGFTCDHYEKENDDAYFKQPVSNFEMHNELFTAAHAGNLHEYYADVKDKLIKDDNNAYGYHFRTEDFYIYLIAHEYKHFADGGTGVRSLLDIYIFMRKSGDTLDWNYMKQEFDKLGITEYEQQSRDLAMKVFRDNAPLTDAEQELLDYHIMSGTYGVLKNRYQNRMKQQETDSKWEYIRNRFFPPLEFLEVSVPWVRKSKLLIPAALVYRLFRGIFAHNDRVTSEIKYLRKK